MSNFSRIGKYELTGAGNTNPINISLYSILSFQITVTGYTSPISLKIEASNDKQNWGNIESGDNTYLLESNGTQLISTSFPVKYAWARIVYISEGGTVNITLAGGNS